MADSPNLAHIPGVQDPTPIDTHGTPTPRESVAPAEIAAGTSRVASTPAPIKITPVSPAMANPVISPEPSGAKVQSFSPLGRHDTTGRE